MKTTDQIDPCAHPPVAGPWPSPLKARLKNDEVVVGWVLADEPLPTVLLETLDRLAPLPLRLVVWTGSPAAQGTVEALPEISVPPPQRLSEGLRGDEPLGPARCPLESVTVEVLAPGAESGWLRLAQLEALCLPASQLATYRPWLAEAAIPALIRLPAGTEDWQGGGLAVADATPEALAGLLLLLATDPPTRRRALDAQRSWLPEPALRTWRVEGVFDSSYSLAIVNRHLALALEDSCGPGEQVALLTYEQGDDPQPNLAAVEDPARIHALWVRAKDPRAPAVALRNAWPPRVRDMRGWRRLLANYAWEETGFPETYVQDFNRVLDLITVVSTQTRRFLQDAGVEVPIAVVGNGIDHLSALVPEPLPRPLPQGFRFLHVSSCFPRKGADLLLKAYGQAFRDFHEVVLIIKTFSNPHNEILEQLARHRAADSHYPAVEVILDDWTPGQIAALYDACQVLVAPSRGEGFGLPIAEAMLRERPVIASRWGGHLDYCDEETAWLIDQRPAYARTHLTVPDSLWCEPDSDHLARLMRELYLASPEQLRPRLTRARERVLPLTWARVAQRTRRALAQIETQPGPLPLVRVGWLSTWGSRCGIAAYAYHLSRAFEPELLVLAPANERLEQADTANVQRLWSLGALEPKQILQAAQRERLDALVIQYHWSFFAPATLAALCAQLKDAGLRVLVDLHNTRSAPPDCLGPDFLGPLGRVDRLLVHTLEDVARLNDWGLSAHVSLWPLCIYDLSPPTPEERESQRQALGLAGRKVLATYGYLMPHKGLGQLIEALPALIAAHPDLYLLMLNAWYSPAASAAELRSLQQQISALGLGGHIMLQTDYLSDQECIAQLALADLIVFPYQHTEESSSAAVRMAIAAERPIAVTPLRFFDDVEAAVMRLPGTSPAELAAGLSALLERLADPAAERQILENLRAFRRRHSAWRRSCQLKGMINGIVRQLELEP
ncbi:glycosyltransferase [Caldichromatium japonicum]|uniref:Glycosyltransferase n=1 Tax=Caldichromatium japonicum TaxID=2699430 RepID=A0A6G7V9V4_9GAMM|nr:glycosyltransferase [Caldichromatium japonicum]QIK36801.1 glycosyltransferase [Caldichromatium japonicum]